MKVLISADMEGTCGVSSWVHVGAPETAGPGRASSVAEYERARSRMTREVNAAVEGALAAGAEEVIVNDAHGGMRNLVPEELHPSVRYTTGNDKPLVMMQGIDEPGVEAVFYTGYHARAGTPGGPLAHTWSLWLNDIRINGVSVGEYGLNAVVAGYYDVPVTMVSGDNLAVAQTRELLGEQVVGVTVKDGYSETSAIHVHPDEALEMIRAGAEEAISNLDRMRVYRLPENATIEIDTDHQNRVSYACQIPGVERVGWRTLSYQPSDALEFHEMFRAITRAASSL